MYNPVTLTKVVKLIPCWGSLPRINVVRRGIKSQLWHSMGGANENGRVILGELQFINDVGNIEGFDSFMSDESLAFFLFFSPSLTTTSYLCSFVHLSLPYLKHHLY